MWMSSDLLSSLFLVVLYIVAQQPAFPVLGMASCIQVLPLFGHEIFDVHHLRLSAC